MARKLSRRAKAKLRAETKGISIMGHNTPMWDTLTSPVFAKATLDDHGSILRLGAQRVDKIRSTPPTWLRPDRRKRLARKAESR